MIATREQLLAELGHNAIYFNDAPTPLLAAHLEKVRRELAQNTTTRIIVSSARAKSPKPAPLPPKKPAPKPPPAAAKKLNRLEAEIEKRAAKYSHLSRNAALRAVAREFEAEIKTLRKPTPAPKVKAMSEQSDQHFATAVKAFKEVLVSPMSSDDERKRARRVLAELGEDIERIEALGRGEAVAMNQGTRLVCHVPRRQSVDSVMESFREKYYRRGGAA